MSEATTRAWIEAHEAPEHELRERYRATLEELYETLEDCGNAAGCSETPTSDDLYAAIESICEERDQANASFEEALQEKDEIEAQLEKALNGKPLVDEDALSELRRENEDLKTEIHRLKAENTRLQEAVDAQESLSEDLRGAVGDVLAMSRRLTSLCQDAGIKPTHVRAASRRKAR
jgi:hypothetical protein